MAADEKAGHDDELVRIALDLSPSGLLAVDSAGTILLANREVERVFGWGKGELKGRPVATILPEFPADAVAVARDTTDPGLRPRRPLTGRRRDGTELAVEIALQLARASGRQVVLAALTDVAARRRAEERFQAAVESSPSGMVLADSEGRIVLVNREAERLFGWSRDELVGRPIEDLVPARFRERHPAQRRAFLAAPSARPMGAGRELYGLRKDGSEIPVEIGLNPLRTEDGLFILSSVVDVTARREAEARLRESEERFRLLVDGVHDHAVLMLDPEGNVASWNVGAQRILGYRAEEMLGRHLTVFYPRQGAASILAEAAEKGRAQEEGTCIRKDGARLIAETAVTALKHADGSVRGYAQILRDVTAQRALEDRLRHSQKLEAIGTLAGGIAHDFNNVLAGIVGYTELAASELEDRPSIRADLENVLRASERGRDLVKRILTFSRSDELELKPLRLEGIVRESLALLRSSLPPSISIREHADPRTPAVRADATQIQQIITNLATNASAAMADGGGVFEVALAPCRVDEVMALTLPDLVPGLHARLTVADTGVGMSPEIQQRIFEPFFTTKPRGSGTGLGLSIVHGIVRSHGGAIVVQSAPGHGTTFRIYLPAAHEHEDHATKPEQPVARAPHVMYCEDEELLARLAERQLLAMGYRVTMHVSSLDALEDFRTRPQDFDAVVTDNTMPHMTGLALAQELLRIRPDLPIIMVSGIGLSLSPDVVRAKGVRHLLPKPHRREELARLLEEVTRRDPPPSPPPASGGP